MSLNFESAREYASLTGSVIAVFSTLYFWLVRANGELGRLQVHPISDLEGCVLLPMEDTETYRRLVRQEGEYCLKYWLHVAVVNNSTLPDALLGASVRLKMADGLWHDMDVRMADQESEFPMNLTPLTTASLKLVLSIPHLLTNENSNIGRVTAAGDAVPRQVPIRIELKGLNDRTYQYDLLDSGDGLRRSEPSKSEPSNRRLAA